MKAQEAKRRVRLQEWANQINDCRKSGLTVNQWCVKTGINKKTYYNRMKRVREELLDAIESGSAGRKPGLAASEVISAILQPGQIDPIAGQLAIAAETPVFAALPMPQARGAPVTVWMGGCAIDIQNGADGTVVEQVLKAVSRL